jgi:hypothetical protein
VKNSRPGLEKQITMARMHLVELALVEFVEEVDGKVPTDEEILREGFHVQFSDTPLSVYAKDGKRFVQYFVWRKSHVVALGFIDTNDLLALSIVRLAEEDWPTALRLYVEQHGKSGEQKPTE